MRASLIALFLAGLALPAAGFVCGSARSESSNPGGQLQAIGKIQTATGSFTVTHGEGVVLQANVGSDGGIGRAKVGDPVYQHDVIQTGVDGTVGLALNDGTAFNVSTNARIVLDEFVYDPNSSNSNSALISLTKGTFTFIAGKVAHTGGMKVDTPVATMGIRGTAPRVVIGEDGTVRFSTLVEDYLRKTENGGTPVLHPKRPTLGPQEKRTAPADPRQRHAANDAAEAAIEQVINDQNKAIEKRLTICRGC